jgi:ABC-type polysaccharide/polyol phosphate transport system ATPase subunit
MDIYKGGSSIRDLFISAIQTPINFFFKDKEFYKVLDNINLTINPGDRIGILGRNGSGKSTLCRLIAGMITPQKGTITTRGDIRSIFNTSIGVIPQLTGRENAQLLAKLIYPEEKECKLQLLIQQALEFSGLHQFLDVPFKSYSKGMQARLCLSIISARRADLLILDEVLDGADQFFKEKIHKRMLNIIESSQAVLFVSHNIEQIKEVCNKVIIIENHKIIFYGNTIKGIHIYNLLNGQ